MAKKITPADVLPAQLLEKVEKLKSCTLKLEKSIQVVKKDMDEFNNALKAFENKSK